MSPEDCNVVTINQTALQLSVTPQPGMGTISGLKVRNQKLNSQDNKLCVPASGYLCVNVKLSLCEIHTFSSSLTVAIGLKVLVQCLFGNVIKLCH